jgi:hypothetical protein
MTTPNTIDDGGIDTFERYRSHSIDHLALLMWQIIGYFLLNVRGLFIASVLYLFIIPGFAFILEKILKNLDTD